MEMQSSNWRGALTLTSFALNRVEKVSLKVISPGLLCGLFDWFICRKQNAFNYRMQCQQEVRGNHKGPQVSRVRVDTITAKI
jgi:hypothetical protein